MFVELSLSGSSSGWVQLELDFATKKWSVQEGGALAGLAFASAGTIETKAGELWLCDPYKNDGLKALVLRNAPTTEDDDGRCSGDGRFVGMNAACAGDRLTWKVPAIMPIRKKILALCAGILPPFPQLLTPGESPMIRISSATHPSIPNETNCYAFPGWIARQLGSTATATVVDIFPDVKHPGTFKKQSVTLSLTKGILALEKFARDPAIKAWVEFDGTNRPMPGDFYVLTSDATRTKVQHVGVIIDSVGDLWVTADSGQGPAKVVRDPKFPDDPTKTIEVYAKGMAAGYRHRMFGEGGTLTGEFGKTAYLKGWVNIDNAALFPADASPASL
jgi:hypothetical protein